MSRRIQSLLRFIRLECCTIRNSVFGRGVGYVVVHVNQHEASQNHRRLVRHVLQVCLKF